MTLPAGPRRGRPAGGLVPLVGLLALLAAPGAAAGAHGLIPTPIATLANPAVRESSGLAVSPSRPGVLWTLNDSGDGPFLFATDATGADLGTFRVAGAANDDWEDLASGWLPDGTPVLYVADTGDNLRSREFAVVYRLPEPDLDPADPGTARDTAPADALVFTYPDGPRDVEALLVGPRSGEILLVAKGGATSPVYRLPAGAFGGPPVVAERVGEIRLPGLVPPFDEPSGGAVASDGGRLAVRTLLAALLWDVPSDGDLAAALAGPATTVALPALVQGESVAFDPAGDALLSTAEGAPAPLYRTALP